MPGRIFINYRRDDSIAAAGRLHDRLAQAFGKKRLFMDVDHIPAGVDFVGYLEKQVAACDVFLAIIGPRWLESVDDGGQRRLDSPDDFVAIEIAAALARDVRVIPVLLDGARMPRPAELPEALRPLARRNAVEVRNTQFGRDADVLVEKVREALKGEPVARSRWPVAAAVGLMVLLLAVGAGYYLVGVPWFLPWPMAQSDGDTASVASKAKVRADAKQDEIAPNAQKERRGDAEDAEQQRVAELKAQQDRKATEAENKLKAEDLERQRIAALKAEEDRKTAEAEEKRKTEEAERQRIAALKAEEERLTTEAEKKRKSDEAERERLAALKAQEDSKAANSDPKSKARDVEKTRADRKLEKTATHPFVGVWSDSGNSCSGTQEKAYREVRFGYEMAWFRVFHDKRDYWRGGMWGEGANECLAGKIVAMEEGFKFSAACQSADRYGRGSIELRSEGDRITGVGPDGVTMRLVRCK